MLVCRTLHNRHYAEAILLMLISSVFMALSAFLGKLLVVSIDLPTLIFFRFLLPMLILFWIALITKLPVLNKQCILLSLTRALFMVLSQYALFYYLMKGSVLDATLLLMTSPLFVPLITRVLQKTSINCYQWISIAIGFVGIVLVLKPTDGVLQWYAIIGLLSGLFNAFSQVYYHQISKQYDASNSMLAIYGFATLITLIPGIIFWHAMPKLLAPIDFHTSISFLMLLILMAIITISTQAFRGKAYSKVSKAASLTPFMYMAIIFSGLFDWIAFDKLPDWLSIIGAMLIIVSGLILFVLKREASSTYAEIKN